jgi:hypothetical protein
MNTLQKISKRLTIIVFLALMATNIFGQVREKRQISGVSELSISDAFSVEIRIGDKESLEIEIDEDYMKDVITEVRGGRLFIKMRPRAGKKEYKLTKTPRAFINLKSLTAIEASGAVYIKSSGVLKGDKLGIELSGASVLDLELNVKDLYLEASGACVITLAGIAKRQEVRTSGATTYSAYELESEIADIRLTGAGTANINVKEKLEVRASGASSVRYRGNPSVNSDSSGASSIRREN